jgi:putative flippase GtrA
MKGIYKYIKAQFASIIAFGVDFAMTLVLAEFFLVWYLAASIAGSISGAITHFLLGRGWVFEATKKKIPAQVLKYFVVWIGHILLTTACIYFLTQFAAVDYALSKIVVAVFMGMSYSYFFQRKFVFN